MLAPQLMMAAASPPGQKLPAAHLTHAGPKVPGGQKQDDGPVAAWVPVLLKAHCRQPASVLPASVLPGSGGPADQLPGSQAVHTTAPLASLLPP